MRLTKTILRAVAASVAVVALTPVVVYAQTSGATPPAQAVIEPRAVELLKAMASKLASAKSLAFTATTGYEYPSKLGPAILYTVRYDVTLQRPNKLRIVVPGDGPPSEFYYDGKQVMAYLPAQDLVAIADAPPTIEGALKQAYERSATYFPFSDLIVSDPYAPLAEGMKLAFVIGESTQVAGVRTDMVAVATDAVFLQLWIGSEDKLPRRIRAVYRDDPLRLRHEMDLTNWKIDTAVAPETFTSDKAKAAKPMQFRNPALKTPQ